MTVVEDPHRQISASARSWVGESHDFMVHREPFNDTSNGCKAARARVWVFEVGCVAHDDDSSVEPGGVSSSGFLAAVEQIQLGELVIR